jgi:hypothetical protein
MKIFYLFLFFPILFFSQTRGEYIGDIKFDEKTDNKNFELCNPNYIFQYFNDSGGVEYKGEKLAIEEEFKQKYNSEIVKKESGLVRIRFVVNCKGETDRFRILGGDENYQEKKFDSSITNQLLTITKALNGWIPKKYHNKQIDYYQYLIFKIKDGKIIEILP